jgi:hypothetical protein
MRWPVGSLANANVNRWIGERGRATVISLGCGTWSLSGRRGPQQDGKVGIRNRKARRIDRSCERPISEPLPKPISHRNAVEPQRRTDERFKKLVALRRVEPRPALHCGRDQIDARHFRVPFEKRIGQTKHKKRKTQISSIGAVTRSPR